MKTNSPIRKKEYSGKGSLRDISAEGSLKEEFNRLTFLQLKEDECVVVMHPDGRADQVCRIGKHYTAYALLES